MKPAPFSYLRPTTLDEALAAYGAATDAKILAGGQSLLPLLSMRLAAPATVIDINRIDELSYVRSDRDGVRIGALARQSAVEADLGVRRVQPLLSEALKLVAHPTIRNRGTVVGSLAHADAAAELPMVWCLLGGEVTAVSAGGARILPVADLFLGPLSTSLRPGEILTEARVPALGAGAGCAIEEVSRRHGDYALCGVAAVVRAGTSGEVASVRAGYLSVSETPVVLDLSAAFADGALTEPNLDAAARTAMAAIEPEPDIHGSAEYRRHLAGVLTRRVVRRSFEVASAHAGEAVA